MMNTKRYSAISEIIKNADAILIGAGAGLSTAAGVNYGPNGFKERFRELVDNYGFTDMYTSSFYNFKTQEEKWSYWAKHIDYLCIGMDASNTYKKLFDIVKQKEYFVITTNVDEQFLKAGFDEDRVFQIQGSLRKIQCSVACHDKLYDDTEMINKMLKENRDIRIPTKLVPICPVCKGTMDVNLRKDEYFVEDDYWKYHNEKYERFINNNSNKKLLLIELGAGFNTPGIIRFPFESMTYQFKNAFLIRVNDKYASINKEIEHKALSIKCDINEFIDNVIKK